MGGHIIGVSLVYMVFAPIQVTGGLNQPSNSPDTTCGRWYLDTGTCAYYTFGCNFNPNPVSTLPTCFSGTMQSPIHLNQAEAVVASVDPGTLTFTGYSNTLDPGPVFRAVGYTLQLDQEATMNHMGTKKITNKKVFNNKSKTKKAKKRNRKKNHKKSREKRSFNDWMTMFAGRQDTLADKPSITGGPLLNDRYLFHHASWHWGSDNSQGSEHHLESKQFPAEIQLYHYNDKYTSYQQAVGQSDGIAALSFFYAVSDTENANLNITLQGISQLGSLLDNMGFEFEQAVENLQLNQLLPSGGVGSMDSYFYYSGSLTNPANSTTDTTDCSEPVLWINYKKTIPISESQIQILRSWLNVLGGTPGLQPNQDAACFGNFRPLHSLNPSTTTTTTTTTTVAPRTLSFGPSSPSSLVAARGTDRQGIISQLFFRPGLFLEIPPAVVVPPVVGAVCMLMPTLCFPAPPPPPPSPPDLPQPIAETTNTVETTNLEQTFPQTVTDNGFCLTQGICEPLIENLLGLYSVISVTAVNLALIEAINSRNLGWTAGQTSLFGKSFASVLAYRMGELPPSTFDRSGHRNRRNTLKFLQEMEESAEKEPPLEFLQFLQKTKDTTKNDRPLDWTVYTTDSRNQGVCSSCAAFAVTAAFETCMQQTGNSPGVSGVPPPTGLSSQNLLDCAFNTAGLAGCDGGQSFRYLQWLTGGGLDTAYSWPYKDGAKKFEVPLNASIREAYARRPGGRRCGNQREPQVVLDRSIISWDDHTERDIENILLDGHAVITTMEVTQEFQHYTSGVFYNDKCDNWYLGSYRDYQWNTTYGLRPLRHAVVIVGFGVDSATGVQFWKVKNSWGPLWGESGFFRILKGYGHCGIGAYISVATCRACANDGCQGPRPVTNTVPPADLPDEGVFLGQTTFLASPVVAQGQLTCEESQCGSQCSSLQPCRVFCGPQCVSRGGTRGQQCCKPLGGQAQRIYCPRRGALCAN